MSNILTHIKTKYFGYIFLTLSCLLIYGMVLKGESGNLKASDLKNIPEYSLRDRGRFLLTENLIQNHTFSLNQEQADLAAPDAGYYKGNWFLLYPPGLSILAIPFYLLGTLFNLSLVFTFAMGGLFAIGTIIFIFLISKNILNLPLWASLFSSFVFGFGSTALGYTTSLFQHHSTAFFIISAFYATYRYKMGGKWNFAWSLYVWLSYGIAIFLDYPNAVLMLPIIIYLVLASTKLDHSSNKFQIYLKPSLILTSIIFLSISFLHGYYNYVNFGSWSKLSSSLVGYREGIPDLLKLGANEEILINELGSKKPSGGFIKEEKMIKGLKTLMFASDRGLLPYNPIFLLSLLGIFYALKKITTEKLILISLVIVNIIFYSSWGDPYAGWAFGPRYLIPVMPILGIFVSYFLVSLQSKSFSKPVGFILFIFSSAIALLGAITTNAVPPKIEALNLNIGYGLPYNIEFLKEGRTMSFWFNSFFSNYISLVEYYFILLTLVSIIGGIVLFLLPRYENKP